MIIILLLAIPLIGVFLISIKTYRNKATDVHAVSDWSNKQLKSIALQTSIYTLFVSLLIFALFDFSKNQFQFVLEYHEISCFNFYLGVDGLSIYFVLLTTIIMPVSLLSNWTSISHKLKTYVITILLLETLLLSVFLVLDILLFYVFFESILPPLFILIGSFGSSNRVRASLYLFLYTLLGSLFLLLSIVTMSSITGTTDFVALSKTNFNYYTELFLFVGIFIAFAVKTPIIFLNSWLLKAHVESPLSGSIILAGIVLKLSLYGILRLILPLLPKAYLSCTIIILIYLIGVITIVYASISTLRTIDVKELIAYSSVSHAAVYLMGVFSNTIQGIEGGIALGLAHGFVSSGLFICVGGVLYDRSSTRLITYYRGIAQMMPLFSVILFILCLGNCGAPLTLNFVGEFLSLYGAFEKSPILGALASSSIIFSAAYTIYMFNRIAFAGSYSRFFIVNISDLNKREFYVLLSLVLFTVALGIYPAPVLDGLHYSVTTLIYFAPNLYIITTLFKSKSLLHLKINSPPKPHAFTSLPVQSQLSYILSFDIAVLSDVIPNISNVISNISNVISNISNVIHNVSSAISYKHNHIDLCFDDFSSAFILYADAEASISQVFKTEHKVDPIVKHKDKQPVPVVDVTYVSTLAPGLGREKRTLVDLQQATGERLRLLWPQTSYRSKDVMVNGIWRRGIQLPEQNQTLGAPLHPETQRFDGPNLVTGILASAHVNAESLNFRVTSKGAPIESVTLYSPYAMNGTGMANKSFIRKNT